MGFCREGSLVHHILTGTLAAAMLAAVLGRAPDLTGTYTVPNQVGGVTVELKQAPDGTLRGRIFDNGVEFALEGRADEEFAEGRILTPDRVLAFDAELEGDTLEFVFSEPESDGSVDYDAAVESELVRKGTTPGAAPMSGANPLSPSAVDNPLARGAATSDPLIGRFSDGNLTLDVQGGGGTYEALVTMGGQTFLAQLQGGGGSAQGRFAGAGGSMWPIAITRSREALRVESQGNTYQLQRVSGEALPAVGTGGPPGPGDVLARGAYGTLTRDNARAYLEALLFCLSRLGAHQLVGTINEPEFYALMAQAYPQAPSDVQAGLAAARSTWTQVQQAWPTLAPQQQLEFAYVVIQLALGPQAAAQLTGFSPGGFGGSGGGSGDGRSADSVAGFDVNPSYDGQGCWASAGCGGYETSTGGVVDFGGGVE